MEIIINKKRSQRFQLFLTNVVDKRFGKALSVLEPKALAFFVKRIIYNKRKATQLCLGLQIVGCPFSIHLINMPHALSAPNIKTKHFKK